ncbi:hypothetical protein [Armatimonas sp.]|uniref:hypothetical protein n=1 Tax=Armatimonas sp. TaxID=1872638 RepID=UPI0037527CDF
MENGVAFQLNGALVGDSWRQILVALHGSKKPSVFPLPKGAWKQVVDHQSAGIRSLRVLQGRIVLEPLSAIVLFQK